MKRAKSHRYNAAGEDWKRRICELGCICCWHEFNFYSPCVPHHRLINGRACQDTETIPLCPAHHQTGGYGVAFHATGRKPWTATFGTEQELFEDTQRRLGVTENTGARSPTNTLTAGSVAVHSPTRLQGVA